MIIQVLYHIIQYMSMTYPHPLPLTFLGLCAKVYGQENPCFINIKYAMVGIFCLANIK